MRLAIFSGQIFWFDGKDYSTDEAFVKFVMSFHPHFEKVVFCDSVVKGDKAKPYLLDRTKAEVCSLPHFSVYSFWKNVLIIYPRIYRRLRSSIEKWDIVWLPGPHPVALLFAFICLKHRIPFFQVIRANLIEQVRHRSRGVERSWAMAVVFVLEYISRRLSRKVPTFTVGREMYDAYSRQGGHVCQIAVSLVSHKEVKHALAHRRSELHRPARILTVARLDPEKGIYFLIEAVEKLIREEGLEVLLEIAGKGFTGGEEQKLHREVRTRALSDSVQFLGHIKHGPELFQLYRKTDVFVLPSLTGEGVPQTLFEAMACGVPIVATKVAGIPDVIKDGKSGILVNPASSTEICQAILRLFADPKLRKRLITCGLATVKSHTLEIEREKMIHFICQFIDEAKLRSTERKASLSNV